MENKDQENIKQNENLSDIENPEVKTENQKIDSVNSESENNEPESTPVNNENPVNTQAPKTKKNTIIAIVVTVCLVTSALVITGIIMSNKNSTQNNSQLNISSSISNIVNDSPKTQIAEVVNNVADSVVEISTEVATTDSRLRQYITEGAGSGVIISSDGSIVTNNHVIDGAQKITVNLRNGQTYDAKLVATDSKTDIALIKIDASNLTVATFANSDLLQVGETAIAIGNPLGQLGGTVTEGIISALNRDISIDGESRNLLQTSAAINPGNSGGGLFNANGELIGIVNSKSSGTGIEGLGFAIPSNEVKDVATQLNDYGYVKGRVDLQMTLIDINTVQQAFLYSVPETGVYISKVSNNSEAAKAGFEQGDKIVSINSQEINSQADFQEATKDLSVGDNAVFVVKRDNQQITINLTLQEYTPSL